MKSESASVVSQKKSSLNRRVISIGATVAIILFVIAGLGIKAMPNNAVPTTVTTDPDLITPEPVSALSSWTSFNIPHPILSDGRVRRAIAYCTNRIELLESVYPLLTDADRENLVAYSFVPRSHWAYPGDENLFVYPFDPEKGESLLEIAGWNLSNGKTYRVNSSDDELALTFTTTSATFRQTWAAVWEKQMKDCGIRITRKHETASWWLGDKTGLARRDFEIGAFAWVDTADPSGITMYDCNQIPFPENGWEGQNAMGWCNKEANKYIRMANNTLTRAERIAAYVAFQREFTKDVPSIPLFNLIETFAYNANLTGIAPVRGEPYYTYNVQDWELSGSDTIVFGFTQEPASLFTLVENAFVANLVSSLIRPYQSTSLNYDFQAVLVRQLPTIENGGTASNNVDVKEGDWVVDANSNVVELKPGVIIKNAAGEEVEYTSGTVTMKQLVSRFEIVDGLTWEDGTPASSADLELGYKISCHPASGATSFISCYNIVNIEFLTDAVGYIQTWLPGDQPPLYFIPGWPIYPSHQLSDLPAAQWATDPRVAELPLSYGPYKIIEWIKGKRITLELNPYWYGDIPKTPNLVIQFISSESAETQLINGEIDILDPTSFIGVTETLAAAQQQRIINILVHPSDTWEHIDFNLFINP